MNTAVRFYRLLLRLYPRPFHEEFGDEMAAVFAAACAAQPEGIGRLLLRELWDLPPLLLESYRNEKRPFPEEMKMSDLPVAKPAPIPPTPWPQTAVCAIFFFLPGLFLILHEIPHTWAPPLSFLEPVGKMLFVIFILLSPIVTGIAWVRRFPRWSYPFLGMALVETIFQMNASTPGLNLFGYPIFGRELWGWRAWIPLAAIMLVALLVSRSLRPLVNLFVQPWRDWTLVTYTMFGFMPLLIAIGFDEVDRLFSLPFMVLLTAVMVGTVVLYLRARYTWQRVASLFAGVLIVVLVTAVAPTLYWLQNGWVSVPGTILATTIALAIFFSPILLGLLRHSVNHFRPAS